MCLVKQIEEVARGDAGRIRLVGVGAACHQQLDYRMLAVHGGKVQGRVTVLTARADIKAKVHKCTACVC